MNKDDIYVFAERLGWPRSPKKTKPFSSQFNYLGFCIDLDINGNADCKGTAP